MGRVFNAQFEVLINPGEKVLWIELLSFSSIYKIYRYRKKVEKVIYINKYKPLKFFLNFFSKSVIGIPIIQLNFIDQSEERLKGSSLYEIIHNSLTHNLNSLVKSRKIETIINRSTYYKGNNPKKYQEHIKESAYYLMYSPVSIIAISSFFECNRNSVFIFRSNPFNEFIIEKNSSKNIFFAKHQLFFPRLISERSGHFYDQFHYKSIFRNKIKLLINLIYGLVGQLLIPSSRFNFSSNNIGVELIHENYREDKLNDLFWLKNSNIDPKTVKGILQVNYDNKSFESMKKLGIDLVVTHEYLIRRPLNFFYLRKKLIVVKLSTKYYFNSILKLIFLIFSAKGNCIESWLQFYELKYETRVKYWDIFYKKIGIKILWSMSDVDEEKLIKSQSIEKLHGIYTGSHWSNYPNFQIINQKCYDLIFAWSELFADTFFRNYPDMVHQITGFVGDHLFKEVSLINKRSNNNQFVITYFDNIYANDLPYSSGMHIQIYQMFIRLLEKYNHIVLVLKPKKFSKIYDLSPGLLKYIDQKRVHLVVPESGQRITPCSVGIKSDLTIGMGISSAAAECCFAGTVSFHADLTGFIKNKFANNALGKAVFRDVSDLELATQKQISGNGLSVKECKELHKCLDPFQDGKAYIRIGVILNEVQQKLILGIDRREAITQ
jgi:hypothetical protein